MDSSPSAQNDNIGIFVIFVFFACFVLKKLDTQPEPVPAQAGAKYDGGVRGV